jgi:polysaccharide export outer membrane protein
MKNSSEKCPLNALCWQLAGLCLLILAALEVAGCQSSSPFAYYAPVNTLAVNYSTNRLQEGDTVAITFQYSTNFNTIQKIPLDGLLNLESIGAVRAAGKTPTELQSELARLYRPQVKDDVITVKLLNAATSVYVSGAVFHPGRIALERPLTPLEAIMEAGGFDPNRAQLSKVVVWRLENGRQKVFHLNLKQVFQGTDDAPFYLKPFDIVHVPTKTFNF